MRNIVSEFILLMADSVPYTSDSCNGFQIAHLPDFPPLPKELPKELAAKITVENRGVMGAVAFHKAKS